MQKANNLHRFDTDGAGDTTAGIFGLPFDQVESNIVIIPVPWEATTSYGRGTAKGPQAVFNASPQLDLFDASLGQFGLPRPWEYGIYMLPMSPFLKKLNKMACEKSLPIIEQGGEIGDDPKLHKALQVVNQASHEVNLWVASHTKELLDEGKIVGILGGDHSCPFGAIQEIAERHPGLGILHIDAHADLRLSYEGFEHSHASIMNNVVHKIKNVGKIVQVGIRDFCDSEYELSQKHPKIKTFFDFQLHDALHEGKSWNTICDEIIAELPKTVYISFDIDGLDPALCPHTGTPVPGGQSYPQILTLLQRLSVSGRKIVGFDLCEVAPAAQKSNEWDGNVGARILYKLCGTALLSHVYDKKNKNSKK